MIFITITRPPYQTAASKVKASHGLRARQLGTTMRRRALARRAQGGGPYRIMTAVRHRSPWGRIGAGVLLLIVAALLVPFVVPVDRFRPLIVRLVEDGTGRKVEISALRLRLWPAVHLEAVNLRVRHPAGFPAGDTLVVKSLDVGTALGSLLARRLDVTYVSLTGVRVNLLEIPGGRTNYDLATPSRKVAIAPATGPAKSPAFSLSRIDSVTIRNMEITSGIVDPGSGRVIPSSAIAGVNARVRGLDVSAPDWMTRMEVTGDLRGITVATSGLSRPLVIQKGSFTLRQGRVKGTFAASLDTLRAEGAFSVTSLRDPSADFNITIPEIDAGSLGAVAAGGSGGIGGAASQGGAKGQGRRLATGTLKIGRLLARPLEAGAATVRMSVYPDRVAVDSYTLALYGGTIRGTAAVAYAAAHQPALLTAQVRGVDVGRMMTAVAPGGKQKITGTLEADGRLATAFGGDPLGSLTGTGTFAVRNGTLPGLDMRNTLVSLARVVQLNIPAGPTKFQSFGGDFRIRQRRVYSDALRLNADDLEADARGSCGFDRTLDYTGTGLLKGITSASPQGQPGNPLSLLGNLGGALTQSGGTFSARVAFTLRGTFDDPKFSPTGIPQLGGGTNQQHPPQPGGNPFNLFPLPLGP